MNKNFPSFPSQLTENPPEKNPNMNKKHFVPMVKLPKMPQFPRDGTERPKPSTPAKERMPK